MTRRNEDVARLLENVAKLLALTSEGDVFRIRAYLEAARTIEAMTDNIEDVARAGRLEDIPGVGASIAAKIQEFLETGRLQYLEELKQRAPVSAVDLLAVPGIGPARAQLIHKHLGISTIPELYEAATQHRLRTVQGFGEVLEARIAREAARAAQRSKRMLLGVALPAAEQIVGMLRSHSAIQAVDPAGSIRRLKETIGDIDILVSSNRPDEAMNAFTTLPIVKEVLAAGTTRGSVLTASNLQVDIRIIPPENYGAALQYFTGSKDHNIALRNIAIERGYKLSEYGLFDRAGTSIAGESETDIYHALGLDWPPPELRENRGEIEAARAHRLPKLISLSDIRGDLHVHSNWSDGHDPPERLVERAIELGYEYLALADHSPSLGVARGIAVDQVREQRRLIDSLNERYAPFRVLHGTEVNIRADGSLDYPDEILAGFDVVTASIHDHFSMPAARMTERIVRAIEHSYVDILGHPTGRLLLKRDGYEVDLETVLQVAAKRGVAIEINGQPDRLDLDDIWSRRAKDLGVLLVCDSDGHSARQLEVMRYAVATARRGWLEPQHVLNTLPLKRLLVYLSRRHRHLGRHRRRPAA